MSVELVGRAAYLAVEVAETLTSKGCEGSAVRTYAPQSPSFSVLA